MLRSILNGIKRMFTLPKSMNSIDDFRKNPNAAIEMALQNLYVAYQYAHVVDTLFETDIARRVDNAIYILRQLQKE